MLMACFNENRKQKMVLSLNNIGHFELHKHAACEPPFPALARRKRAKDKTISVPHHRGT